MVYLRLWKSFDLEDTAKQLLVVGELSAECFNCHELGIESRSRSCPKCGVFFRYVGFRRKVRAQDLKNFKEALPQAELIDFSDFKDALKKKEARDIFNET